MPNADIPESNSDTFAPGKSIDIEAGYEEEQSPIFQGFVTTHKLSVKEGNKCVLEVECHEYTFPLTQGRKNRVFTHKTDKAVIESILGETSGLNSDCAATSITYNELVQYYCTDWDFILSRADMNGLVITTNNENIVIKPPVVSGEPVVRITYGMDLISFEGELTANDQQTALKATGWDIAAQEIITEECSSPSLNAQGNMSLTTLAEASGGSEWTLQTEVCAGPHELKTWGEGQLLKMGLSRIQGTVSFYGNASVIPGCLLALDGLGNRFNGNAYIGSVEHTIRRGEWITTSGMGLPYENVTEKTDVMAPAASGLLPGISGLHIGKVTKLDEDPAGEGRIQVEIPILNSDENKIWARVGCNWAGNRYGSFFIPDVGDEVILGFFNNDPCSAVILGSLYSSCRNSPHPLTAENTIRGFVTKESMKLTFNEEDKIITLETPGGNKVVISDKEKGISLTDENRNKLVMNDNGITLQSARDLTLKAQANIKVEANQSINIKAQTDLKSEALNIESKAKIALKMQGTASAEISASGQTTVKGAMVMIN